ncbi:hypothetical protein ACHAXR_012464, partial [Thalassiosira sp. AJA248-18]
MTVSSIDEIFDKADETAAQNEANTRKRKAETNRRQRENHAANSPQVNSRRRLNYAAADNTPEQIAETNRRQRENHAANSQQINSRRRLNYAAADNTPERIAETNRRQRENHAANSPQINSRRRLNYAAANNATQQEREERRAQRQYIQALRERVRGKPVGCKSNIDIYKFLEGRYYDVGGCTYECFYCNALGFKDENKGTARTPHYGTLCCNRGTVIFPIHQPVPERLFALYTGDSAEAKHFQKNIRFYNAGMAMASLQVNDSSVRTGGPSAFKVYGQMHRRIGSMTSATGSRQYSCIQAYFCDPSSQDSYRANRNQPSAVDRDIQESVFRTLRLVLTEDCTNRYLQSFFSVNEYIQNNNLNPEEVRLELHATTSPQPGIHNGRLNLPSAPEISLLLPVHQPMDAQRVVVCSARQTAASFQRFRNEGINDDLEFFQDYHQSYMPLMYPLLFPHGTNGWTLGTKSVEHPFGEVQLAPYSRFYLMERGNHANIFHHANRLYQQLLVDLWGIIEGMRISWMKRNQRTIRADLYFGLRDSIRAGDVSNSGATILAASFTGGDRWYHKGYKNAMAL